MLFVRDVFRDAQKYDSFFLKNEGGKIKELCGVFDINPDIATYAFRINQAQNDQL